MKRWGDSMFKKRNADWGDYDHSGEQPVVIQNGKPVYANDNPFAVSDKKKAGTDASYNVFSADSDSGKGMPDLKDIEPVTDVFLESGDDVPYTKEFEQKVIERFGKEKAEVLLKKKASIKATASAVSDKDGTGSKTRDVRGFLGVLCMFSICGCILGIYKLFGAVVAIIFSGLGLYICRKFLSSAKYANGKPMFMGVPLLFICLHLCGWILAIGHCLKLIGVR